MRCGLRSRLSTRAVPVERLLVVLDPNVLVSAALSPAGAPAELIRRWLAGEFELVVSPVLLDELRRVLADPKIADQISAEDAVALVKLLEREAETEPDPERPRIVLDDPDDDYLVALALTRGAALISGDKHLTAFSDRLPIYRPADFVLALERRAGP